MAKFKFREPGGQFVEIGGGPEEVAVGAAQPTGGEEIWIDTSSQSNAGMPTGAVIPFAAANAPAGWLICDGSTVSRTAYADLFSVVGTTYGTGDGSTTFHLPNLKGRVPVGRDASQAEFDLQGETGGAKTHTLTVAEIPNHDHQIPNMFGAAQGSFHVTINSSGSQFTAFTGGRGGGGAHNNLQPYIVLTYIIKT